MAARRSLPPDLAAERGGVLWKDRWEASVSLGNADDIEGHDLVRGAEGAAPPAR